MICTRCKKIKLDDGFKMCEGCRAIMRREYYSLRRDNERARGEWMAKLKAERSCLDCGASYPDDSRKLIWDHRPGEVKIANISDMVYKGLVDEVLEEIKKCDLLCVSCHTKRGWARGQMKGRPPRVP